jgi:hypothetical protein
MSTSEEAVMPLEVFQIEVGITLCRSIAHHLGMLSPMACVLYVMFFYLRIVCCVSLTHTTRQCTSTQHAPLFSLVIIPVIPPCYGYPTRVG